MATIDEKFQLDLSPNLLSKPHTVSGLLPAGVRPEYIRHTMEDALPLGGQIEVGGVSLHWLEIETDERGGAVVHMPVLQELAAGADRYLPLYAICKPVRDDQWHCQLGTDLDFVRPALLALVEAVNKRHGAALVVDQDGMAEQPARVVENEQDAAELDLVAAMPGASDDDITLVRLWRFGMKWADIGRERNISDDHARNEGSRLRKLYGEEVVPLNSDRKRQTHDTFAEK
jgi:hypothetical protein